MFTDIVAELGRRIRQHLRLRCGERRRKPDSSPEESQRTSGLLLPEAPDLSFAQGEEQRLAARIAGPHVWATRIARWPRGCAAAGVLEAYLTA